MHLFGDALVHQIHDELLVGADVRTVSFICPLGRAPALMIKFGGSSPNTLKC